MDKDEEVYRNACNMTTLNKWLRRNITVFGGKGSSSSNPEQKGQDEEATRKAKEETTRRSAEGAKKLLSEEAR